MKLTRVSLIRHLALCGITVGLVVFGACSSEPPASQGIDGTTSTTGAQPAPCVAPAQICDGACVDLASDASHCGGCSLPCAAGQICQVSVCVAGSCAPGQTLCDGACVDMTVDSANCGSCGLACAANEVCSASSCNALATTLTAGNGTTSGTTTGGPVGTGTPAATATATATATSTTGMAISGAAMSSGAGGAASTMATSMTSTTGTVGTDERPWFSFFVTSLPGLREECGQDGCGGDLGGLSGADAICARLAQAGNPGDTKTWRAFLSTTGIYGDMVQVDAIDRVGSGPWWDWHGRMLAPDVESLLSTRPSGGDPALRVMFVDETGTDIQSVRNGDGVDEPDNHDSLTGSGDDGRLYTQEGDGSVATCQDWTSTSAQGDGQVPVGHAWPRQSGAVEGNGAAWIQDHTVNGCEPSVHIGGGGGACDTCFGVGDGGGYGAFYCFALDATPPASE